MITIKNATEQLILNSLIISNTNELPLTFIVKGYTITIKKNGAKGYVLNIGGAPKEYEYNSIVWLLHTVYTAFWNER